MTAARPAPPPTSPLAAGPAPRRVRPPRWLDLRLLLGILLVLGSVLLGARVVGAADATVPVWAAAGDLAAGTELDADDLVAVDVRRIEVALQRRRDRQVADAVPRAVTLHVHQADARLAVPVVPQDGHQLPR